MRWLLLTVLLAIPQTPVQVPGKAANDAAGSTSNVTKQGKETKNIAAPASVQNKENSASTESDSGNEARKDKQEHIIVDRLPDKEVLDKIYIYSTADAAQRNITIITSKERARIMIEVDPIDLSLNNNFVLEAPYRIHFWCPTPAFIVDAVATARLREPGQPHGTTAGRAVTLEGNSTIDVPKIITRSEVINKVAYIWAFDEPDIKGIQEQSLFIHFDGFIAYRDVFSSSSDPPHKTRFHYLWHHGTTGIPGYWEKCGSDEENSES